MIVVGNEFQHYYVCTYVHTFVVNMRYRDGLGKIQSNKNKGSVQKKQTASFINIILVMGSIQEILYFYEIFYFGNVII